MLVNFLEIEKSEKMKKSRKMGLRQAQVTLRQAKSALQQARVPAR